MPRLPLAALACAVLALGLGACGDDSSDDASSTSTPGATSTPAATSSSTSGGTVAVSMKNIKFVPESITVKVGQEITWTNDDGGIPHNVTAEKGADFASDTMQGGDTFTYTPKKAGTIDYVCTIHSGQTGTIIVTR